MVCLSDDERKLCEGFYMAISVSEAISYGGKTYYFILQNGSMGRSVQVQVLCPLSVERGCGSGRCGDGHDVGRCLFCCRPSGRLLAGHGALGSLSAAFMDVRRVVVVAF